MTTLSLAVSDSKTMLRRNIRHMQRYPSLTLMLIGLPVVFLLLFVFVFGNTLGAGLGDAEGGYAEYLQYIVPGILLMAIAGSAQGTAIAVAMDMSEGIIARFRTMAISRAAVLTGHVVGSMIQAAICLAAVIGIAFLVGFRPTAGLSGWLGAIGMLAMITFAITWFTVAMGIVAKSVETASNSPMFLMLLPFLGSGFVPTESMPAGVRWFAEYQPFTPFIEAVRGLMTGTPSASSILVSTAWCVVIAGAGYLWARSAYDRQSVR
jgi:ABC-2 type transport system permease protein